MNPLSKAGRLARLARRAAAGEHDALRRLYRALHDDVHRFVHRRIANPSDADDLVADVFVRVVDHLGRYDAGRGSVRTWVLAIARNAVIDHVRAHRPTIGVDEAGLALVAPLDDFEQRLDRDSELRALAQHVEQLDASARELLGLRYGDGLGHREIAGLLGLSEDAVKQRCSRLIRELRAASSPVAEKGKALHVV